MPLPQLPPDRTRALFAIADRFVTANRVSLRVGFVITPLLFGGIGLALGLIIPAPFGLYVGGSVVGAGFLLLLFLLWYRQRTIGRPPFGAWASVEEWRKLRGRHGEVSYSVVVAIEEARALSASGWGEEIPKYRGVRKTLLLTSRNLLEAVPSGRPLIVICMPTTEVVAFDVEGRVIEA